jgi:quercetin dioxygenase-like cupin family protein
MSDERPTGVLLPVDGGEAMSDRPERTVRALFEHPMIDVTWSRYEPGQRGPDPHVHHEHTDAFYVVEGELVFGLGGELREVCAPAGTFVLVPPEVIHTFGNEGGATARWLNFHAPSTGFIANLRSGTRFDSYDAPADGGRSSADALVVAAGAGESIPRPTRELAIIAETLQLSALELLVDPGFVVDPHTHADEVDSFYLVEGEIEFTVGTRAVTAGAGTWVSAPPGARHGFRNAGGARARLLNVHAPETGFVGRVRGQR